MLHMVKGVPYLFNQVWLMMFLLFFGGGDVQLANVLIVAPVVARDTNGVSYSVAFALDIGLEEITRPFVCDENTAHIVYQNLLCISEHLVTQFRITDHSLVIQIGRRIQMIRGITFVQLNTLSLKLGNCCKVNRTFASDKLRLPRIIGVQFRLWRNGCCFGLMAVGPFI